MTDVGDERPIVGMGLDKYKTLFRKYQGAVLPIIVVDQNDDEGVGTAFHVGDGVFVTAKHVVFGMKTAHLMVGRGVLKKSFEDLKFEIKPSYHKDERQDVAAFKEQSLSELPVIPLGGHLDDWINDNDFILNDVLLLGYPPIPFAKRAVLMAATAQVNAVVDLINVGHVHFIVSAIARGGFSGGPVISEWDFVLGMVTHSLLKNGAPEELGYLTVLTVEPILDCLAQNHMLPKIIAEQWDGLFTSINYHYGPSRESNWANSFIDVNFDGHSACVKFACPDEGVCEKALEKLQQFGDLYQYSVEPIDVHSINVLEVNEHSEALVQKIKDSVESVFAESGLVLIETPSLMHRVPSADADMARNIRAAVTGKSASES